MSSVPFRSSSNSYYLLPDTAAVQNEVALFIFTIPMGTLSQDLFVDPIYRSVRNNIAKRCQCEISVFDGNTMSQRTHSGPKSAQSRVRFLPGNILFGDAELSQSEMGLLINISNPHEQVLFARGNWIIQVTYLTEPSEHHLFLKLVVDFATRMNSSGGMKRGSGTNLISQGFKYTTLVALTHEKLRHAFECGNAHLKEQEEETKQSQIASSKITEDNMEYSGKLESNFPREWGEIPSVPHLHSFDELQSETLAQTEYEKRLKTTTEGKESPLKPCVGGDFVSEEPTKSGLSQKKHQIHYIDKTESTQQQTDFNFNHQMSDRNSNHCQGCMEYLEALQEEERRCEAMEKALGAWKLNPQYRAFQSLAKDIDELECMVNLSTIK